MRPYRLSTSQNSTKRGDQARNTKETPQNGLGWPFDRYLNMRMEL